MAALADGAAPSARATRVYIYYTGVRYTTRVYLYYTGVHYCTSVHRYTGVQVQLLPDPPRGGADLHKHRHPSHRPGGRK